jgi:hypothetical protein
MLLWTAFSLSAYATIDYALHKKSHAALLSMVATIIGFWLAVTQ